MSQRLWKSAICTVEIWTPDLTYIYPNIDEKIEALTYSSAMCGGCATCSFTVHGYPWKYYPEFALGNVVRIRSRHQIVWEGRISAPSYDMESFQLSIQADGYIERLKSRLSTVSMSDSQYGGAWITANLIGDTDLGYLAGTISNGYQFPVGLDFAPEIYYADAVAKINEANGFQYGFFPPPCSNLVGNRFDFRDNRSSPPDYYLDIQDCEGKQIQYTLEGIENYLHVSYCTDPNDNSSYAYFWWPDGGPDAISEGLYGRRDGILVVPDMSTLPQAQQWAATALELRKRLRPSTDIVAHKITDPYGVEVPLTLVQAGKVLHIRGLNPGEFTLLTAQSINELCTWPIVMATMDIGNDAVTLSPGGLATGLDIQLARAEMNKR